MVSGGARGGVAVWHPVTGETVFQANLLGDPVRFITSGRPIQFIAGAGDGSLHFFAHRGGFDFALSRSVARAHQGNIDCIASHARRVVTSGEDRVVRVWNADSQEGSTSLRSNPRLITCVSVCSAFIVAGSSWDLSVWDARTLEFLHVFEDHRLYCISGILFLSDHIVLTSFDSNSHDGLVVADLVSGTVLHEFKVNCDIADISVSRDGRVAVCSA